MSANCLGLDVGQKRIGVAISHIGSTMALPLKTISNNDKTVQEIISIVTQKKITKIIVGLPINPSQYSQKQTEYIHDWVKEMKTKIKCEWIFYDERYSTIQASHLLHQAGINTKKQKKVIDAQAAAVILQGFLDTMT